MKKSLLTLIMALVMALACATSAFAAEELGYVNVYVFSAAILIFRLL